MILSYLKKIAETATKDPWYVDEPNDDGKPEVFSKTHLCYVAAVAMHKDATHIATFSPTTVLALIQALERAQEALKFNVEELDIGQSALADIEKILGGI